MNYNIGPARKISAFECYCLYAALKAHFSTERYDFFKFRGRVRSANEGSLQRRNDRKLFTSISKRYNNHEIIQLFVSNYIENERFWIGDGLEDEHIEIYRRWKGKIRQFHYWFERDCEKIFSEPNPLRLDLDVWDHPELLQSVLRRDVLFETFIVLDILFNICNAWNSQLKDDLVWKNFRLKMDKYKPFLGEIPLDRFIKIVKKVLTTNDDCGINKQLLILLVKGDNSNG